MSDVLNEAALGSQASVLSTAALANSSKATQSYASPIGAMFWVDASGNPLAGFADYGGVVSLCVVCQVFGVSMHVEVFQRSGGGVIPIASADFVSSQLNQTFRLDIDTRSNPHVYGGTRLEGDITYAGLPPDFQDSRLYRVDTPALSMDVVPYVRTVMRARGWAVGATCQDRWFNTPYSPGKSAKDLVVQDVLKMQWATGFSYIARVVENGFTNILESVQAIALRDKIKGRIKDQVRNGLVALPAKEGAAVAFGTKSVDLEVDGDGNNFPRFNRYSCTRCRTRPWISRCRTTSSTCRIWTISRPRWPTVRSGSLPWGRSPALGLTTRSRSPSSAPTFWTVSISMAIRI